VTFFFGVRYLAAAAAAAMLAETFGAAVARRVIQAAMMVATVVGPWLCLAPAAQAQTGTEPPKVLRYAFRIAETGFDTAQVSDIYSRIVIAHIVEGLYHYDHLARPYKIKPMLADGMPEVSADFKIWTVKIKPGIYFADDPAFKGKPREVVAEDFVYALKRFADPKLKSPSWSYWDQFGFLGLSGLRKKSIDAKQPFDYDTSIPGLQAVDRHTLRITMDKPAPRFLQSMAQFDLFAAFAREVDQAYGEQVMAHPVGTGPFKLTQWRRSSRIVLERNPTYRERTYDAEPAADDKEGQALLAKFKGRKLPMVDRVEVSIIDEEQPRWLSFNNNEHDFVEQLPFEFVNRAVPNGKVAPYLAKRGMQAFRMVRSEVALLTYNLEHPVVGGITPDKVALRRAINLALDTEREIRMARFGQAIPAQSIINPNTAGYDPSFKSENGTHDPVRAKALLDLYGYVDKDGDGWRDLPDGSPLVLEIATQPDGESRRLDEVRKTDLDRVGIRTTFAPKKWPENMKAARAGNFMVWAVGSVATAPDGFSIFMRLDGRQVGSQNLARFKLPAFDALYDRIYFMPDGPERLALMAEANKMALSYAAYKPILHRIWTDMAQPWMVGYRRPLFWNHWWSYVDVDATAQAAAQGSR
jgi:ABC-type transport system substrate-binding protein